MQECFPALLVETQPERRDDVLAQLEVDPILKTTRQNHVK
jgi:hypothetical protein